MFYEHTYINNFHRRQYNATTLLSVVQPVGLGLKSRQSRLHNSAALAFLGLWSGIPVHHQIIFYWLWDLGSGLWDLSSSPVAVAAMNWSHNQSCHFYGWRGWGRGFRNLLLWGKVCTVSIGYQLYSWPIISVFVFLIAGCLYQRLWAGRSEEQVRGAGFWGFEQDFVFLSKILCFWAGFCVFDCMVLVIVGR